MSEKILIEDESFEDVSVVKGNLIYIQQGPHQIVCGYATAEKIAEALQPPHQHGDG